MKKAFLSVLILILAAAAAAAPVPGGASGPKTAVRGVWAHPGSFGPDQEKAVPAIRKTLDEYVQAGIDTVILMIKGTNGYVYYKSAIGVPDPAYKWDFLGVFLKEAGKRKITVHPWFCVFPEAGILGQVRRHPEWLIVSPRGEMVGAANPALPEVRQYELSLMMEVARNYPVDWIHLDYIRFPCDPAEPYFSFDPQTRALFKEYSGWDPLDIKARDSGNMIWNEWLEWNRSRVTLFVAELRAALKTTGRTIKISAAVFPDAANAGILIGQDWAEWADKGLVDMLCPMLYTNHEAFFTEFVRRAVAYGKGHCQVCAGIGIGTSHNQNTPDGMIRQMKISQGLGADGVILFSSSSLGPAFLEALKAGQ
ncbi:MAG: family 10 glycosylhydrolase [Acidobacteriota bacterium]